MQTWSHCTFTLVGLFVAAADRQGSEASRPRSTDDPVLPAAAFYL